MPRLWLTFAAVTIRGAAHTAPFSPWSFGDCLSRLLPLLCLGELCLVSVFTSRRERAGQIIAKAAPTDPAFSMPAGLAGGRCLWFAAGAGLLLHQLLQNKKA